MYREHAGPVSLLCAVLLGLGCADGGSSLSNGLVEPFPPMRSTSTSEKVYDTACGDKSMGFHTYVLPGGDGCDPYPVFEDEIVSWSYETFPVRRADKYWDRNGNPIPQREIWVTAEHRESDYGEGSRVVSIVRWPLDQTTVTVPSFTVRYFDELSESKIMGYTAWCDAQIADDQKCWDARRGAHHEVMICAVNRTIPDGCADLENYETKLRTLNTTPIVQSATAISDGANSGVACASYQLSATARDDDGDPLTYTWSSSPEASSGAVSGSTVTRQFCQAGPHEIRVLVADTRGGLDIGTFVLEVVLGAPPAVASVTVSPNAGSVTLGGTTQFTATVRDASGAVLTDRVVTWQSSNPAIAQVSPSGTVTGVAVGTATIQATSEGQSDTATVTVTDTATTSPLTITRFAVPQPAGRYLFCNHEVQVSGGIPPYSYRWQINGKAVDPVQGSMDIFTYVNQGVDYQVGVAVYDAAGGRVLIKTGVTVVSSDHCPEPTEL